MAKKGHIKAVACSEVDNKKKEALVSSQAANLNGHYQLSNCSPTTQYGDEKVADTKHQKLTSAIAASVFHEAECD